MNNQPHIVLLDNFDSFTYNLVDEVRNLGFDLTVYRNNVDVNTIYEALCSQNQPTLLMLSPGPGTPSAAGCMPELIKKIKGKIPVLGICLGHQCIVEYYGGTIDSADQVKHGKASAIAHNHEQIFGQLPQPLTVARYHSLMATKVPNCLDVIAKYENIPMAVYHQQDKMLGFQFHPESILTAHGSQLLTQSIEFLTQK